MVLPDNVKKLLDECRRALIASSTGALPLRLRKRLLLALGEYRFEDGRALRSNGYYRRVTLACACAAKVEPFWERRLPNDRRPARMIELARAYMSGNIDRETAESERSSLVASIMDMTDEDMGSDQYAGLAAAKAVTIATKDEDLSDPDASDDDEDLDVWSWSPAYTASIAYAYAEPTQSDSDRRREFWRWWLDVAVADAYSSRG